MLEIEFEQALVDLAHTFGWHVAGFRPARTSKGWRTPVKYDGKGFPDLTLAHPEHGVVFAELKADRGRLSPEQAVWHAVLKAAGARVFIWYPSDANEIAALLSGGRVTEWNLT